MSKQINHHWIQQAYIKEWKIPGNPLYEFDKGSIESGTPKATDKILSEDYYYSITLEDSCILRSFALLKFETLKLIELKDKDFAELFDLVKKYRISFDDKDLFDDIYFFATYLEDFEEWIIVDLENNSIGKLEREQLLEKLNAWHHVEIENKMSVVEHNWHDISQYAKKEVLDDTTPLIKKYKEELAEYIYIQKQRDKAGKEDIANKIKAMNSMFDDDQEGIFIKAILESEKNIREHWLLSLYKMLSEIKSKSGKYYDSIEKISNKIFEFQVAADNLYFLTSDCPIIISKEFSYFPITPKVILKLSISISDDYTRTFLNESETKKINNLIIKNATNYIYSNLSDIRGLI